MKYRYFFINAMTPLGPTAAYIRAHRSPHHPEELARIQEHMAVMAERQVAMMTKSVGQTIPRHQFLVTYTEELEEEVAKARWPEDFGLPPLKQGGQEEPEEKPAPGLIVKP